MIAAAPIFAESIVASRRALHVLTLTPFYPGTQDDGQGCFVAEPLQWTEKLGVANRVIGVQPFYRSKEKIKHSPVPARRLSYFAFPGNWGLPSAGRFLAQAILQNVQKLHRAQPIDLIHAHGALPCGDAALLLQHRLGIPIVVTVHGLDAFSSVQAKGFAATWCEQVSRKVYRSAERVICVSEKVRQEVICGEENCKAEVIYNGVDASRFAPSAESEKNHSILSIGNLIPIKGHELLLHAITRMKARFPSICLKIIGDGPEQARLRELAHARGIEDNVTFLGRQSRQQVVAALQGCSVFALPSRYEALGCVYLEAMATAKPVVACHGQGISEIIKHGVSGWLITPGNLDELTSALTHLLEDAQLRSQLGRTGRTTILERFTLAHQAERLAALYEECA